MRVPHWTSSFTTAHSRQSVHNLVFEDFAGKPFRGRHLKIVAVAPSWMSLIFQTNPWYLFFSLPISIGIIRLTLVSISWRILHSATLGTTLGNLLDWNHHGVRNPTVNHKVTKVGRKSSILKKSPIRIVSLTENKIRGKQKRLWHSYSFNYLGCTQVVRGARSAEISHEHISNKQISKIYSYVYV